MYERFKRIMLYGNADREQFFQVYPEIVEQNRRNLSVFSLITAAGMILMLLASLMDASLVKNRSMYTMCLVVNLVIALTTNSFGKRSRHVTYICVYAFTATLLYFGIALGTFIEPNQMTVSYPIMLFGVPLLFTDFPARMNTATALSIAVYIAAARATQNDTMFAYNLSNILPYGTISLVVSTYMMTIKIRSHTLEVHNRFLSESDQMTGMLNRRSYEQKIQELRNHSTDKELMICALDVNGLKNVNDNLGHHAGDELIRGAADSITGVFGAYGRCYRVGGDEFIAILEGPAPKAEELRDAVNRRCACFHGTYVSGLSLSIGIVQAYPECTIDELIKAADHAMYKDKEKYYHENGLPIR